MKKKVQRLFNLLFISVLLNPTELIINFGAYIKQISCLSQAGARFHFSVVVANCSEQNRRLKICEMAVSSHYCGFPPLPK